MRKLSFAIMIWIVMVTVGYSESLQSVDQATDNPQLSSTVISLDAHNWLLATDPKNVGRTEKWFEAPRPEAKRTKVPDTIQEAFPSYHGVAWYWLDFKVPRNPSPMGRILLRFSAVDYLAEVWLNGNAIGKHEGGETPFTLDITDHVKTGEKNRLALRVLNPSPKRRIDNIVQSEVPQGNRTIPLTPGSALNYGGIVESVDLLIVPGIYIEDLHVRPDPKTGIIQIHANVQNSLKTPVKINMELTVEHATSSGILAARTLERTVSLGCCNINSQLKLNDYRLWEPRAPNLYRVTARMWQNTSPGKANSTTISAIRPSVSEFSARCGFRDFRFENGYFRLNGRRIYLKSALTGNDYPLGLPHDPDLLRRDLINHKAMGFNMIRFIAKMPKSIQLDICDEIGLMVYEECYAAWKLGNSPKMPERYDRSITEMIRRDRNHPSVVMWGILNETPDGHVFRHAVTRLPLVRALDKSRLVILNSGRHDCLYGGWPLAGIEIWSRPATDVPSVTYNPTKAPIRLADTTWAPGRLALCPKRKGEYSAIRWTADAAGTYSISAKFNGLSKKTSTNVHVLHKGRPVYKELLDPNSGKKEVAYSGRFPVNSGDTIVFAVGCTDAKSQTDNTGLSIAIKSEEGRTYDIVADFSVTSNPNGAWSYGYLLPGASPDASTFRVYERGHAIRPAKSIGSLSNPGSTTWENVLGDEHPYKRVPHTADIIHQLRTIGTADKHMFVSEYGVGSAVNLTRLMRHFEQLGETSSEGATLIRNYLDKFMADWDRWKLADTWANPQEFFKQCLAAMAKQRTIGFNAVRSNPNVIGFSPTQAVDPWTGEGMVTLFRELKTGTVDAVFDGWYPVRLCLFAEPVNIYRKRPVHLEAVLSNLDALAPGEYPVRIQVIGPGNLSVFDRDISVRIPDFKQKPEPKFALPVFAEDVLVDGPSGKYRFLATFRKGAAAAGGDVEFYVADPAEMPKVESEVILWGDDAGLRKWLYANGIKTRQFGSGEQNAREVILVGNRPPKAEAKAFRELASHIARGSQAVFLSPKVFQEGNDRTSWLPLIDKGRLAVLPMWLYRKDDWAKNHPIFDGLPAGGLMDHTFYRELIYDAIWVEQEPPVEAVAGAIDTSLKYASGLTVSVHSLGGGRFILNALRIREHLGNNPVADRLLVNMLRYLADETTKPPVMLPANFEQQLKSMGY
ncbi:MAG: hypothetical protein JXM70_20650 [Pirellulales bacterium]|nr:hypothetical protein [Pirellulales bacterium]